MRRYLQILSVGIAALAFAPAALARPSKHVCGWPQPKAASCNALVVTDSKGAPLATATPSGYGPSDLRSAYSLPSTTGGAGQTVAIVDAYNDPNAESDLSAYRAQYGLGACTTANGCFRKVNQNGGTIVYPRANSGWAQEISLDLDMASAVCPNCHILLVEAANSSLSNLGTAVNQAARLGATTISNSYGGSKSSLDPSYDNSYYNHPGIAITVSSGDSGYGVQYPAASRYVTAVGGTSLTRASNARGWSETAWSGAGSGCSAYDGKPTWQTDAGCTKRTVADVSAVADPNTGWRSTTPTAPAAGSSLAARAWPPRSLPACTRWPATRTRSHTEATPTATPALSSTSPLAPMDPAAPRTFARPDPATTVPQDSARRTALERSRVSRGPGPRRTSGDRDLTSRSLALRATPGLRSARWRVESAAATFGDHSEGHGRDRGGWVSPGSPEHSEVTEWRSGWTAMTTTNAPSDRCVGVAWQTSPES